MSTGYAILMDIEGHKIDFSKSPKLGNCKRIEARSFKVLLNGASYILPKHITCSVFSYKVSTGDFEIKKNI